MESLKLPIKKYATIKWHVILLSLIGWFMFFLFALIYLKFRDGAEFSVGVFLGVYFALLTAMTVYYLHGIVFKKFFIEITHEKLYYSVPFRKRWIVRWESVSEVGSFSDVSDDYITIFLKEDSSRNTFINSYNSLKGYGAYSFKIVLSVFRDLHFESLIYVFGSLIDQNSQKTFACLESEDFDSKKKTQSRFYLAFLVAFTTSYLLGILFALIIYWTKRKFFFDFMTVSSLFVIAAFNKYYIEASFNILVRVLTGLLCLVQVMVAVFVATVLTNPNTISFQDDGFVGVLANVNTANQADISGIMFASVICFILGAFKGRT